MYESLLTIFKFGLVGASGVAVDFGVTWLLKEKVGMHKVRGQQPGFFCAPPNEQLHLEPPVDLREQRPRRGHPIPGVYFGVVGGFGLQQRGLVVFPRKTPNGIFTPPKRWPCWWPCSGTHFRIQVFGFPVGFTPRSPSECNAEAAEATRTIHFACFANNLCALCVKPILPVRFTPRPPSECNAEANARTTFCVLREYLRALA